eukprot:8043699-Pyramimonas_sp.AAC.1
MLRRASRGHLGPTWGSLGSSWTRVVPAWRYLGLPGSPFGWLWGAFGASQAASDAQKSAVLERREAEKRSHPKPEESL